MARTNSLVRLAVLLLLADLHVADGDGASLVVDAPAVFLYAVDALCVGADIIDIHHQD